MNSSTSCDRVWRKRLNELSSVWPDFVSGHNTGLHKTRVASRRIREALPVVGVCAPQSKVKKLNKKMRALTRYLGPIRELDVELDILDAASKAEGVPGRAIEMVRREIATKRQALRHELAENAPVGDVKKLIRKLERVGKREEGKGKGDSEYEARWRSALAARVLRRAKSLGDAARSGGTSLRARAHSRRPHLHEEIALRSRDREGRRRPRRCRVDTNSEETAGPAWPPARSAGAAEARSRGGCVADYRFASERSGRLRRFSRARLQEAARRLRRASRGAHRLREAGSSAACSGADDSSAPAGACREREPLTRS